MSRSRCRPYESSRILSKRGQSYIRRLHNQKLRRKGKMLEHEACELLDTDEMPSAIIDKSEGVDGFEFSGKHWVGDLKYTDAYAYEEVRRK